MLHHRARFRERRGATPPARKFDDPAAPVTAGTEHVTETDQFSTRVSCLMQPEVWLADPRYSVWRLTKLRHRVC